MQTRCGATRKGPLSAIIMPPPKCFLSRVGLLHLLN